ncbi:MAG: 30S ribosomal protein S6 [Candidatus Improbicoccus devescovinae]|nr:MAG: 30S ribosomal protein S6 [Candidatus Improbicoccus devescovinae]
MAILTKPVFKKYELYVLFNKTLNEEAIDSIIRKFLDIIKLDSLAVPEAIDTIAESEDANNSESIDVSFAPPVSDITVDKWGKRRLAYPINGETEAVYACIKFSAGGDVPAELKRVAQITEGILRILILKSEETKK